MSARPVAAFCLLLPLVAGLAAPVAASPPPRPVSGFAHFDNGEYSSHGYPTSGVANVTLTVDVAANGTSTWTERATLTSNSTVAALRANDSLRRAVVAERFGFRFDRHTTHLRSRLDGSALVVSYRLDDVVHRGVGGGLLLAPFAGYTNVDYPGEADVTIHAPDGYRVVRHPNAMVSRDSALRWNATTGPGDAGVEPGLVTFAPARASFPGVRAELATFGVYALPTFLVGLGFAFLFGVPIAVVLSGVAALGRLERRTGLRVAGGVAFAVGLVTFVVAYPVTVSADASDASLLLFLAPLLAVLFVVVGAVLHLVAWRRGGRPVDDA